MNYNLNGHTKLGNMDFYNCDCMELLKQTPDNYYSLALVDPPYGINVNMNAGKKKGEKARYHKKDWDVEIPSNDYFKELFRVSKNQMVWGGNYFTEHLYPSMGWICWNKGVPDGVSFSDFELAWTSFNIAAKMARLPYAGFIGLDGTRIHPTEKPIKLYEWILMNYAQEGDKILDTHLGSGTIARACHNLKFDLTACELDKDYYDAAMKRINNHIAQLKIF